MRLMFFILLMATGCSGSIDNTTGADSALANQIHSSQSPLIVKTYMTTGFYFLAEGSKGIKMRLRGSDEFYTIAPNAVASSKNIFKVKLEKTLLAKEVYTSLCMTFDAKGTAGLKAGTGNILHPKLAVILANQLLYVVDNNDKITTGVMCVDLMGYTDSEMKVLLNDVKNKK